MSAIKGRKLSIENATLIGQGYNADVYLFDDENVVKVLKHSSFEDADREIQLSKWALKQGIPTAISYDVIDVDGRPGLVYESLGRGNLRNILRDTPERFDEVLSRYNELLHTVNSIVVEPGQLPDAIDAYSAYLEKAKCAMTGEEYERMKTLLGTVPKCYNLVHGDFHVKNVKVMRNELLLIDLDTLKRGDAIFELAALCRPLAGVDELQPGDIMLLPGVHVWLFLRWLEPDHRHMVIVESGGVPEWKCAYKSVDTQHFLDEGYRPYRYLRIRE